MGRMEASEKVKGGFKKRKKEEKKRGRMRGVRR